MEMGLDIYYISPFIWLWKATVKAGAITSAEICVRLYGSYEW